LYLRSPLPLASAISSRYLWNNQTGMAKVGEKRNKNPSGFKHVSGGYLTSRRVQYASDGDFQSKSEKQWITRQTQNPAGCQRRSSRQEHN
ncbi:MAG: hypothetical protein ACK53Y_20930, partial [bacterium]